MLDMKEKCESCGSPLPTDSDEAMICSYECTFCEDCAEKTLHGICPNCKRGSQAQANAHREEVMLDWGLGLYH